MKNLYMVKDIWNHCLREMYQEFGILSKSLDVSNQIRKQQLSNFHSTKS